MRINDVYKRLAKTGIEMLVVVRESDGYRPTYINGDPKNFKNKILSSATNTASKELRNVHEELFCNFMEFGVTYFIDGGHNHTLLMDSVVYKSVVLHFIKQIDEAV